MKEKNCVIISVDTEAASDEIISPFMIFQNPLGKLGIGQNLSPFVIFIKAS